MSETKNVEMNDIAIHFELDQREKRNNGYASHSTLIRQ